MDGWVDGGGDLGEVRFGFIVGGRKQMFILLYIFLRNLTICHRHRISGLVVS